MNNPHGGKLVNRITTKVNLDLDSIDLELTMDSDQVSEIKNIGYGVYSPLEGYMNKDDFESVLEKMTLANGTPWSIPVVMPVNKTNYSKVGKGSQVLLKDESGKELAVMIVEDKYDFPKEKYYKSVYGTTDKEHPGVAMVETWDDYIISGEIWVYGKFDKKFEEFEKTPEETRKEFEKNGWKTIVGFQTRNPAHMAHEYIQKLCLEFVDGLFINPIMGKKKPGDFKDEVILSVYSMLVDQFYPKNSTAIGVYTSRMNYAGPKEAVMHAIVRKNFGCTHFIVGRDHAGVGDYYDKFAAHRIFDEIEDFGMEIMRVSAAFYDRRLKMFATEKTSPFNPIYRVSPSGTQVRKFITEKNYEALRQVMRDEVLDIIFSFEDPFVA